MSVVVREAARDTINRAGLGGHRENSGSVLNVGDVTRGLLQEWYNLVCLLEEPSGCGLETKLCGRGGSNKKRNKKRHRKPIEGFIAEILPEMIGLDQRQEFWLDGIGGENEKEK